MTKMATTAVHIVEQNEDNRLSYSADDRDAFQMGRALTTNTQLKKIDLKLTSGLTIQGATALFNGLKHSQVTQLTIRMGKGDMAPMSDVVQLAIDVAMPLMREAVCLDLFPFTDEIAEQVGASLSGIITNKLKLLKILVGGSMTDHGARRLASGFHHNSTNIEQLELDLREVKVTSHNSIMPILFVQAAQCVQELTLSCYEVSDDAAIALGEALVGNTSLKLLDIIIPTNLTEHGASGLAKGIRSSQIRVLKIRANGKECSTEVQRILYEQGVRDSDTVRHLLIDMRYGVIDGAALAACVTRLHRLELEASEKMDPTELIQGLKGASELSVLFLQLFLKARHVVAFSAVLPYLTSLECLSIRGNLTSTQGREYENEHFGNGSGQYLDFKSRNIQAVAAQHLMIAVANHPCIQHLSLKYCRDIGFVALEAIGRHLSNVRLRTFDLGPLHDMFGFNVSHPSKHDGDSKQLAFQRACQALVVGIRSNIHLQNFRYAALEDQSRSIFLGLPQNATDEINFYIDLNKSGRFLLHLLNNDQVPPGVWCHILATSRNKASTMFYFLREHPALRIGISSVGGREGTG